MMIDRFAGFKILHLVLGMLGWGIHGTFIQSYPVPNSLWAQERGQAWTFYQHTGGKLV